MKRLIIKVGHLNIAEYRNRGEGEKKYFYIDVSKEKIKTFLYDRYKEFIVF